MTKRRASEEEVKLFKAVIDEARPLRAKPSAKIKAKTKTASRIKMAEKTGSMKGGLNGGLETQLRRGQLSPQARLDLHGLYEAAAYDALLSFLRAAQKRGDRLVLVITGKGARDKPDAPFDMALAVRGVLKSAVPRWLREAPFAALIAGVRPAHRHHGGEGALYVYLRKKR